jgi:Ca2+-binding EF-hand superfamily protein
LTNSRKALDEYGCGFTRDELQELFNKFDKDGSGSLSFDEFLQGIARNQSDYI